MVAGTDPADVLATDHATAEEISKTTNPAFNRVIDRSGHELESTVSNLAPPSVARHSAMESQVVVLTDVGVD